MKYGGFSVSTPYFFLLRFVSSFCGSLFVNLRFHWILSQMPVNRYNRTDGLGRPSYNTASADPRHLFTGQEVQQPAVTERIEQFHLARMLSGHFPAVIREVVRFRRQATKNG